MSDRRVLVLESAHADRVFAAVGHGNSVRIGI
jgi:hypothetical protein